jgi:hypothetical protein
MRTELKRGDIVLIEAGAGVGRTMQIAAQGSIGSQAQKLHLAFIALLPNLPKTNLARNATSESHERALFWITPNDA